MTLKYRAVRQVLLCLLFALGITGGWPVVQAQGIFDSPTDLSTDLSTDRSTKRSTDVSVDSSAASIAAADPSASSSSDGPVTQIMPVQLFVDRAFVDVETGDFLSRYRVGPGDVISIRLFGEDDLNRERIRITDVGSVPYPVLGEIRVLGLRPVEIERLIEDGLRGRYLRNPRVSVTIDEYRPYFVTGEVGRAGSYAYTPGITVIKAITIAGGFKERASRSKIFVSPESNPTERRKVELTTPLEPGDILTIEESFF